MAKIKSKTVSLDDIHKQPWIIQHIDEQNFDICMAAVSADGAVLKFIKNQTKELCLAAVRQNGYALEYVEKQTVEICLAAVMRHGHALLYVKRQNNKICLAAVKQNGFAIMHVKIMTDDVFLTGVEFLNLLNIKNANYYKIKKDLSLVFKTVRKSLSGNTPKKAFFDDRFKYCGKIISSINYDYVISLKSKIPEIFETNDDLKSVYEKIIFSRLFLISEDYKGNSKIVF